MAKYNNDYEKLLASIQGSGQTWSDYDLGLAQKDPDAGFSIFEAKNDWLDAQKKGDKAAMDAANKAANNIRNYYGSYDGGADGAGYTKLPTYAEVPQFTQYESKYADQINDLYDSIQNRDPFTYSPDSDVSYQAYAEKYRNAGRQARDETLGSMAAMTGGIPSSYAMTAAQQAQNNYNAALSDVLPQLEQLAYSKYANEGSEMRSDLAALMQMDNQAYQQHLDSYNNALNAWQLGYGVDRDRVEDMRYADETDYSRQQYERELALEQAMTMLNLGLMPSSELLSASRMQSGDVQAIYNAIREQMAQDTKGSGRSSGGTSGGEESGGDLYADLMAAGVTDYGTAYQYLRSAGYGTTDANRYAKYFAESYYPAQKTKERAANTKLGKTTAANYDAMGANYQEVASTLADMKASGAATSEILSAIKDAYDNGVLNQSDYMKLTNKYRG